MLKEKKKRIVICSDGTWNDPEKATPTNVLRVARAISPTAPNGMKQVVFYDWGVGTYYAKTTGGAFGLGLIKNVQDGYRFIVQNYQEGDEIFLFGFSRGAYTVRCLAGMLNKCGILRRENAEGIPEAFAFYKNKSTKPGSARAGQWRKSRSYGAGRGPVKFLGVWDTVGSLGIPVRMLAFVEEKDLFYDDVLGSNVEVARHAVSIDERRADFQPTLWSMEGDRNIKQVWFSGVHADVGGGCPSKDGQTFLSDIPLAWMVKEARREGLKLEKHLLAATKLNPLAEASNSHKGFWRLLGKAERRIPSDGLVHESVKVRYSSGVKGSQPLKDYLEGTAGLWKNIEK